MSARALSTSSTTSSTTQYLAGLRARFPLVLASDAAMHFDSAPDGVSGVSALHARQSFRRASVTLPHQAGEVTSLGDETSGVGIRFSLAHAQRAPIELDGDVALYRGAFDGADVVQRVYAEGTEDFVVFAKRPPQARLDYEIDVSRVPGLRLVENTLEFIATDGTPVLRVSPPYVIDAAGVYHGAKLAISGCNYDVNPAEPWGRATTSAGASHCTMHVTWDDAVTYPAIVDPAWVTTGAMGTSRQFHTSTILPSGKVLVIGGCTAVNTCPGPNASAELYDPAGTGTFAATGALGTARQGHTATLIAGGNVLVVGGQPNGIATTEIYRPALGTFASGPSMSTPRRGHTANLLASGKVLIAGGANGVAPHLATAEIFDPAGAGGTGSFTATGSMASPRGESVYGGHTGTTLASGKVLMVGGRDNSNNQLATAEVFDPAGNGGVGAFTLTGPPSIGRRFHTATLLASGKVLVVGGSNTGAGTSTEIFDPLGNGGAGSFSAGPTMSAARSRHAATKLSSGIVLISGGRLSIATETTLLFDPAGNAGKGTLAAGPSLVAVRDTHNADLLPSGTVLITGGSGVANAVLASAERFGSPQGAACTTNTDCFTGFCTNGFCCDKACDGGACDRCDLAGKEGTCTIAPAGDPGAPACGAPTVCDGKNAACPSGCTSDDACAPNTYCAPSGKCEARRPQAAACAESDCKAPGCRVCASGFCVDGVCCDAACNGTCQACAAEVKYTGAESGTCDSAKAGLERGGLTCGVPGARCDGDHTSTAPDGTRTDCAPYRCESNGACRVQCASVADCVGGTACTAAGKCEAPSESSEGGCLVAPARSGRGSTSPYLAAGLVALALLARRRR